MGMLDGMFLRSEFFINLYNKISGKHVYFAGLYVDKFLYSCVSSLGFYSAIIDMPVYYDNGAKLNYSGINSRILFSRSEVEVFLLFFNYFLKILFLVNFMLLNFFTRFVHVLSVGLGFRKRRRLRRGRRFFELYMGNRHRVSFELPRKFYVILIRRGNIIFFSNTKNKLWYPLICFRNFRKELAFKLKGFFIRRKRASKKLMRIWAFARRVKFKEAKIKLSKKQKMI